MIAFVIALLIWLVPALILQILLIRNHRKLKMLSPAILWLVPYAGLVMTAQELWAERKDRVSMEIGLEGFDVTEARYKHIDVEDRSNEDITVPLEEAIVVDDSPVKRRLIVDVLNRHPENNVSLLERASRTDDTEVSHYATTAMASIQSGYEGRIADLDAAYSDQKNPDILRSLRNELSQYIGSGLVFGRVLYTYEEKLDTVLAELLDLYPGRRHYHRDWVENRIRMGKLDGVVEELEKALREWPDYMPFYRSYGDYAQAIGDSNLMQEVIRRAEASNAYFTRDDHDWIDFWEDRKDVAAEEAATDGTADGASNGTEEGQAENASAPEGDSEV